MKAQKDMLLQQAQVKVQETLNVYGIPSLNEVLYFEGLRTNMISVSQLYDSELQIKNFEDVCKVYDDQNIWVLSGHKSLDNCYKIDQLNYYHHNTAATTELCHKILGHFNYQDLTKLVHAGYVKGVPELSSGSKGTCGACKSSKQIRSTHKAINLVRTTRLLELVEIRFHLRQHVNGFVIKCYICNLTQLHGSERAL